jgi:integrase
VAFYHGFYFQLMGVDLMASVSKIVRDGRVGYRIRFYCDKRRRELYVPGQSKNTERRAIKIAAHVDDLSKAKANNVTPSPEASAWAAGTDGRLRDTLVSWGLAEPASPRLLTVDGRLLGPFCDAYIDGRTDTKASTRTNYRQSRRLLVEYFGESKAIAAITAADCERWRRWLLARPMAVASVSKHIKRAKTMFAHAVDDRLIKVSPFSKVKAGDDANPSRQWFIDRTATEKIIDQCPDMDWRCIFALARFGGLRCPSEVLGLRWADVDWAAGKLRIDSPKTGLRFCPLFPELRAVLSTAFELADDGAVYVVAKYRGGPNLRTQLIRIAERAGLTRWPKLFNNLRASRRTELQEQFPSHVIDAWMGHSTKVAEKHYLQVTDEHWAAANNSRPPARPPIANTIEPIASNHEIKKTWKNQGFDGLRGVVIPPEVTPMGFEPMLPP